MTKKELLKILKNNILKIENENLYEKYYNSIEAILFVFPNYIKIENLNILKQDYLKSKENFNNFLRSNRGNLAEIDKVFSILLSELKTWAMNFQPEDLTRYNNIKKNKKIGIIVFMVIIGIVIVTTIVITFLGYFNKFTYTNELSLALDGLGLISGLVFFAYERYTDINYKNNTDKVGEKIKKKKKRIGKNKNIVTNSKGVTISNLDSTGNTTNVSGSENITITNSSNTNNNDIINSGNVVIND